MGRAGIDGSGIDHEFIEGTGTVSGVAVGSRHVFWSNRADGTIGRARLDGTGVDQDFISGAAGPGHLAVDGSHIYWTNLDASTIGRATLGGTSVDQDFIPTLGHPAGLAVDDDHVYWVNANITPDFLGSIGRADLDGSDPDQTFTTSAMAPSFGFLSGVAVDTDHIYWADFSYPSVVRAGLDGGGVEAGFIPTGLFTFPRDVAVDPLPLDEAAPETTIVQRPPNSIRRSTARYRFTASELGSSFECRRDRRRPCADHAGSEAEADSGLRHATVQIPVEHHLVTALGESCGADDAALLAQHPARTHVGEQPRREVAASSARRGSTRP